MGHWALGMGNGALGIGKREAGRLGKRGRVGEWENLPSSFFLLPSLKLARYVLEAKTALQRGR